MEAEYLPENDPDLQEEIERDTPKKKERPMCQQRGCPNRATCVVAWTVNSYFKVFCDRHASRTPKGYLVAELVGYEF